MLVQEAFGYDRFGRRCVSREEMEARCKFAFRDAALKPREHKPLSAYDNGKRSFPEQVAARYEDEALQLRIEYQDFFTFPQSPEFASYMQQKQQMAEAYHYQKRWVDMYRDDDRQFARLSFRKNCHLVMGCLFAAAGTLNAAGLAPFAIAAGISFYTASAINFWIARTNRESMKNNRKQQQKIKMVLEDWYTTDPMARYDRANLNEKLAELDGTKPTVIRRDSKRALVAAYRKDHPRVREA